MTIIIDTPDTYQQHLRTQLVPLTTEDGNLTIQQFLTLLFYILEVERPNVILAPSYPQYLIPTTEEFRNMIDNPTALFKDTITYMIIKEEPSSIGGDKQPFGSGRRELIPRVRSTKLDNTSTSSIIHGQFSDAYIQFDIWSLTALESENLCLWFRRLMTTYRGFFKQRGLSEIHWWWRGRDEIASKINNRLHVRSLIYFIRIEELVVTSEFNLKKLEVELEGLCI